MYVDFWINLANITQILTDFKKINILSLGETHIRDEPEEMFKMDGFTFLSRPRSNGRGGGVGIYVKDDINWIRRNDLESNDIESIWIEIFPEKSKSFLFSVIYKPPVGSHYLYQNFTILLNQMLSLVTKSKKEAIIMGDLNTNYLNTADNKDIKSIFNLMGFKQLIKKATRIITDTSETLIDIIQTNNPEVISTSTVIPIEFSDHDLIACVRKLNHQTYKPKTIEFRDYKNYTPNGMCQKISAHGDFNKVIADDDVNTCWNNLKSIISTCLDDIAPKIKKRIRGKPSPWLTLELKTQMNLRDALFRKRRKTKMLEDIQNYRKQKNLVNRMVKRAKKSM